MSTLTPQQHQQLKLLDRENNRIHTFRYIIHGIPKDRKYTVEEAKWSHQLESFTSENTYTVSSNTVKKWLGYVPSHVGELKTIMWISFPHTVYGINETRSPLKMWEQNHYVFAPYSFERLRYFPDVSTKSVQLQANHVKV